MEQKVEMCFFDRNQAIDSDGNTVSVEIPYIVFGASTEDEALALADIFDRMIKSEVTEEDLEKLDEAAALQDISHMPARVKCAMLGWRTMKEMLSSPLETK